MESKLLELKVKVDSLNSVRKKLLDMKASFVGFFSQIDTYFNVPKGKLKVRVGDEKEKAELIYYEREYVSGLKRCNAWLLEFQEPDELIAFFERILGISVVIEKKREIYNYRGTKIHLDSVKDLGFFIEFERETIDFLNERKLLNELLLKLEIENMELMKGSYSDIALKRRGSNI